MDLPIYHRPTLAEALVRELAGEGLADYSSGMFLAAPRRTGKTTFLKHDLMPACKERGWLPVYVDLWADKNADPAVLIADAIAEALREHEGAFRKMARKTGIQKINLLRTVSWDLSSSKLPEGTTLTQALDTLHQVSGKLVVLIIDEAQHALNSESGVNATFALKAARDHLTQRSTGQGLRLIFTGSSRDKLANLVLKSKQPFYGATITSFPLLDRGFVEFITPIINERLADTNQLLVDDVDYAFRIVGHRPEMLRSLIAEVSLNLGKAGELKELLISGALAHRNDAWTEYESAFNDLTPIQQAVLKVIGERVSNKVPFSPFTAQTLEDITRQLELSGSGSQATTTGVQRALEALREKELVWKASRGDYALEDAAMAEWLASSPP